MIWECCHQGKCSEKTSVTPVQSNGQCHSSTRPEKAFLSLSSGSNWMVAQVAFQAPGLNLDNASNFSVTGNDSRSEDTEGVKHLDTWLTTTRKPHMTALAVKVLMPAQWVKDDLDQAIRPINSGPKHREPIRGWEEWNTHAWQLQRQGWDLGLRRILWQVTVSQLIFSPWTTCLQRWDEMRFLKAGSLSTRLQESFYMPGLILTSRTPYFSQHSGGPESRSLIQHYPQSQRLLVSNTINFFYR